ncbi:DUF6779 domain-containing protein [Mycolicibacterium sp. PO1]
MTDPTRGARLRRGGRRPGWILMTVLLVLAIAASSALVFTNRVELLKLAVILALWAAVVAAFVSVIYRRQSDSDQAKVRDLKLVYDLQLDREISARREYELSVEAQLRRELVAELRAQQSDEVSALRAELAALRANLEFLFDADLSHRHAIEADRSPEAGPWTPRSDTAGRVSSSRIDTEGTADEGYAEVEEVDPHTEESPIIDVPAEPHPPEGSALRRPPNRAGRTDGRATTVRGGIAPIRRSGRNGPRRPRPAPRDQRHPRLPPRPRRPHPRQLRLRPGPRRSTRGCRRPLLRAPTAPRLRRAGSGSRPRPRGSGGLPESRAVTGRPSPSRPSPSRPSRMRMWAAAAPRNRRRTSDRVRAAATTPVATRQNLNLSPRSRRTTRRQTSRRTAPTPVASPSPT